MPNCGRIKEFRIGDTAQEWVVEIDVSPAAEAVDFSALLAQVYGGAVGESSLVLTEEFEQVRRSTISIPKRATEHDDLQRLLSILRWTVTISDDADESHAIYLHDLPHPVADSEQPDWQRTRMGKMVRRAKSYSPTTGSKPAAKELAEKYAFWLERHPRYLAATAVIAAPPGNMDKSFDLPEFVAQELSRRFGLKAVFTTKVRATLPQKDVGDDLTALARNVEGGYAVNEVLTGMTVLVIDDIYRSGSTLKELNRACKEAGAATVLSLTATKTAKYCNGFTPGDWYQVSMEAANYPTEDQDE